jgi:hypothetical protein
MTTSALLALRSIEEHPDVARARQALVDADFALEAATSALLLAEQARNAIELDAAHGRVDERRLTQALEAEQLAQSRQRSARHRTVAAVAAVDAARTATRRAVADQLRSDHTAVAKDLERQLSQACATSRHAAALEDASIRLCVQGLPAAAWRREFGTGADNRFEAWRQTQAFARR